jgi:hypothetical protein
MTQKTKEYMSFEDYIRREFTRHEPESIYNIRNKLIEKIYFEPQVVIHSESLSADAYMERYEWCKEVMDGRFHVLWYQDWFFKTTEDAIMYKLRWL